MREHVEAARHRQATVPAVPKAQATPVGLRADLALAREEIKRLRAERDKLQQRLRLQLGAEIDGQQRAELITRVADLQAVNRRLIAERDARTSEDRTPDSSWNGVPSSGLSDLPFDVCARRAQRSGYSDVSVDRDGDLRRGGSPKLLQRGCRQNKGMGAAGEAGSAA